MTMWKPIPRKRNLGRQLRIVINMPKPKTGITFYNSTLYDLHFDILPSIYPSVTSKCFLGYFPALITLFFSRFRF
jgi:hypothetical protein